ncbi:hypothetical protein, partial [Kingella pumchi]
GCGRRRAVCCYDTGVPIYKVGFSNPTAGRKDGIRQEFESPAATPLPYSRRFLPLYLCALSPRGDLLSLRRQRK